jgi:hypothetical protein
LELGEHQPSGDVFGELALATFGEMVGMSDTGVAGTSRLDSQSRPSRLLETPRPLLADLARALPEDARPVNNSEGQLLIEHDSDDELGEARWSERVDVALSDDVLEDLPTL